MGTVTVTTDAACRGPAPWRGLLAAGGASWAPPPDVGQLRNGVNTDSPVITPTSLQAPSAVDDVLRADIRLLTTLLGETLVRSEGREL
ncbi:MAG: hypothetical protein M4D85_07520, partial [Actinomycetota bacterium]|nr:hypothetical protein [Actinomycetota bacterium]